MDHQEELVGQEIPINDPSVWDDSALISAWDSAVEEYKKFHGEGAHPKKRPLEPDETDPAASGHKIQAINEPFLSSPSNLHHLPFEKNTSASIMEDQQEILDEALLSTGMPFDDEGGTQDADFETAKNVGSLDMNSPTSNYVEEGAIPDIANIPQVEGVSSQEDLINLLSSWYYSGYYTGYYMAKHPSTKH